MTKQELETARDDLALIIERGATVEIEETARQTKLDVRGALCVIRAVADVLREEEGNR